jgi:hypothetical protein
MTLLDGLARRLALAAAIVAAVVDVAYASLMRAQSAQDPLRARPVFVAFFIGLAAAAALLASRPAHARLRPALLGLSAAGLLGLGDLAIFSIGIALLLGGALAAAATVATLAARPGLRGAGQVLAGVFLALVVLAGGMEATERWITCPPTGYMGGSGQGLLSGPYHYACVNGRLTMRNGP